MAIDADGVPRWETLPDLLTPRTKLVSIGHVSNVTGAIAPVTFETCPMAMSFVFFVSSEGKVSQRGTPSGSIGIGTGLARTRQGSQLAWCSLAGNTTSSSGPRPRAKATRLMASVVPRTNTISAGEALMRPATSRRAAS